MTKIVSKDFQASHKKKDQLFRKQKRVNILKNYSLTKHKNCPICRNVLVWNIKIISRLKTRINRHHFYFVPCWNLLNATPVGVSMIRKGMAFTSSSPKLFKRGI